MRLFCYLSVLAAATVALAGGPGGRAKYIGGTNQEIEAGREVRIVTTDPNELHCAGDKKDLAIPYRRINLIEYGQKVNRRIAMAMVISPLMLLSKARAHFVTIGYQDEEGRQQALVFRVEKGDVRSVLASLEARTGLRVEFQDEEARKAGRG